MKTLYLLSILILISACSSSEESDDPRSLSLHTPRFLAAISCDEKGRVTTFDGHPAFWCQKHQEGATVTTYLEVDEAYLLTKVRAEIRGPQKVSRDTASAAHQTLSYLLKSYTSASPDLLAGLIDRCEGAVDLPAVSKDGGSYQGHLECRKPHFSDDAFLDLDITYSAVAS